MRIIQSFCFQTFMIARLMCSKVVPLPFVVLARMLKLPHEECVLNRFEAAHVHGHGWLEHPILLVPSFLISALTISVQLRGPHVQFFAEFCLKIWNAVLYFTVCHVELVLFLLTGLGERGLSEELELLGWRLLLFGNEHLDSDACKAQLLDMAQIPVILEGREGGLLWERWPGSMGQVNRVEEVCNSRASLLMFTQPGCMSTRADGHAGEFELELRLQTVQWVRGRRPVAKCSCLPQRPGLFQRLDYPWQQKVPSQPFLPLLSRLCLALKELFMAVCLPANTLGEQELRHRTRLRRQCLGTEGGRVLCRDRIGAFRHSQGRSGEVGRWWSSKGKWRRSLERGGVE